MSAVRALTGLPQGSGAQWRREAWASVGLLRDDLSTAVLSLGIPGDQSTSTGRALAAWQAAGQPVLLTLRQLVKDPPRLDARDVFVCENPVVVSTASDRLGNACAPLVCTGGQPGVAAMHLFRQLVEAGCKLHHHGDFEWGGLHIGNLMFDRLGVQPWRFGTADYLAGADRGRELTGRPVVAHWDAQLADTMQRVGVAVEEEHVLDDLVTDLTIHT